MQNWLMLIAVLVGFVALFPFVLRLWIGWNSRLLYGAKTHARPSIPAWSDAADRLKLSYENHKTSTNLKASERRLSGQLYECPVVVRIVRYRFDARSFVVESTLDLREVACVGQLELQPRPWWSWRGISTKDRVFDKMFYAHTSEPEKMSVFLGPSVRSLLIKLAHKGFECTLKEGILTCRVVDGWFRFDELAQDLRQGHGLNSWLEVLSLLSQEVGKTKLN